MAISLTSSQASAQPTPCISVHLQGQLGNQMFQIATTYAHSRRLGWQYSVPSLATDSRWNIPENRCRFFTKIPCFPCPETRIVREVQNLHYQDLPAYPGMVLDGFFQTERYFADYRDEILQLFSFQEQHWTSLLQRYPELSHPCKIGVQLRIYHHPTLDYANYHPVFGRGYFEKAFAQLPQDALYVVVSNHVGGAKRILEGMAGNFLFLSETDRFDDLLILSRCEHVVSTNSSFGWWGAWLGDRPGRRCIFPVPWFSHLHHRTDCADLLPSRWEVIDCPEDIIPYHVNPTAGCISNNPSDLLFK